MKGKALALSLSFLMLTGIAVAEDADNFIDDWESYTSDLFDGVCSAMTFNFQAQCIPSGLEDISFADGDGDTVHNSIHTNSAFVSDSRDVVFEQVQSHADQSFGISMGDAKLEAVKALNKGEGEAEATSRSLEEVNAFWKEQEMRVVRARNKEALAINESFNTADDADDVNLIDVFENEGSTEDYIDVNVENATHELFTGEEVELLTVDAQRTDGGYDNILGEGIDGSMTGRYALMTKPVDYDGTLDERNLLGYHNSYRNTYDTLSDRRQQSADNIEALVTEVYNNYEQGEIDPEDILTPIEALQVGSTSYEDTGYYGYLALSLEQEGIPTNDEYAFNVTWDNVEESEKTAIGQLFVADDAYNETIETGVEYDASNENVWLVHESDDGEAVRTSFDGTFTVNEMTDTSTGDKIESTTLQSTEFYTPDTSELQNQLDDIRERYNSLEAQTFGGFISGALGFLDGLFSFDLELKHYVLIGLALYIVFLIAKGLLSAGLKTSTGGLIG